MKIWMIGFALLAGPAFAQNAVVDCANAQAQVELTYCAEQDWLIADDALNAAYKEARAAMKQIDADLPADQRGAEDSLKEAQRAWVTFRDKACDAVGYRMHGGSAELMVIYGCRAMLTEQRTDGLRALVMEY